MERAVTRASGRSVTSTFETWRCVMTASVASIPVLSTMTGYDMVTLRLGPMSEIYALTAPTPIERRCDGDGLW
jgi:hypothetical protein